MAGRFFTIGATRKAMIDKCVFIFIFYFVCVCVCVCVFISKATLLT